MIVGQLPSLEEIYDYSSEDLRQIVARLADNQNAQTNDPQKQIDLSEYIENINIELQQRKTLQFFQELCALDNPYVKKVTDFNNQFLKLAEEALAEQEKTKTGKIFKKQDKIKRESSFQQCEMHDTQDGVSVTSATSSNMTNFSKTNQSQTHEHLHTSNQHRLEQGDKKIGLGGNKRKTKNSMKDFILSTLTKNKADCTYVVKKGGPPKPQPTFTVNERGHLVNPNSLQPISTKSLKSNSSLKPQHTPLASTKQLNEGPSRGNDKQLQKKRQEVVEKLKGKQPEKKRERNLNNKDLVEMIREQERKQQLRQQKEMEKQRISNQICEKDVQVDEKQNKKVPREEIHLFSHVKEEMKDELFPSGDKSEEIKQEIEHHQDSLKEIVEAHQQAIEQHITLPGHQNVETSIQNDKPVILVVEDLPKSTEKAQQKPQNHIFKSDIEKDHLETYPKQTQIEEKNETIEQISETKPEKERNNIYEDEIEELKQMQKEADMFDRAMNFKKKKQQPFGVIVDLTPEEEVIQERPSEILTDKDPVKEEEKKKCYNEDYWIHIREEAEFQIKRFKEEKELQDNHKNKLKKQIKNSVSDRIVKPQQEYTSETQEETVEEQKSEKNVGAEEEIDEFYEKKKKQLKKMVNDHKRRVVPKRATPAIMAPQKPLYALPEFNYLQIYPTFNHIFSVMYTKAEHQALQDVPSIMKQLTNIFTTHINHFKSKNTFFQAAIFLPFDSSSKVQLTDPKQLLLHTQSTYVNLKKMVERLQTFNSNLHGEFNDGENRYYRVVKTKEEVYDIITTGFLRRKYWKELPHGCSLRSSWNLFWSWSKPDIDVSKLLVWQRINHFPFNKNLSRKDLLYKNLDAFRKMIKIPFSFLPLTFNLPKEYTQFSMKFHEQEMLNKDMNYWIMKPIGKSRGRGIKVISNLAELNYTDNIVVQKYITNPLLLEGYKFDMRIYVLVTSFHPLEAFVYREGFARLSTEKFNLEPMMIKNAFVHLTNFSINRTNEEAKQTGYFAGGSKISLKTLKDKLTKMNYSFTKIWSQVHEIIIKSLLGCSISVPPFPAAFELFGYDIMIDTDGGCHLIQINASPSLERSYLIDEVIKQSLIDDILDIVDPPEFDKEQLLDIMSDRLSGRGKITPEEDLIAIARCLKYKKVRRFGQIPESMGLFERVAPSELSGDLQKLIKGRSGANNPRNID